MRSVYPVLFLALAASTPVIAAIPRADWFVRPKPLAPIYHDGWVDLNKNGTKDLYEDPSLEADKRIEDLVARMTLEEKTAQMTTLYGFPRVLKDELPTDAWKTSLWKDGIGNIDEDMNGNVGENGQLADPEYDLPWSRHTRAINEVQRWFVEETRLGIPVDFTNEGIRGLLHSKATSFPAEIGVASCWDLPLTREIGRVTGREARALGYTNVYSPVLEVARDPRWGRIVESYGEDPFLVSEMGVQQVLGIQEQRVVSTLKHFAVYSIPKGGRDGHARTDPKATWSDVQTIFLQPFRRAVRDAGALGIMASYNDYDGTPIEGSKRFLTDILRREWGFKGYVVSDSAAVEFIHQKHRVAPTPSEGIRMAVEAGLNIRTNFTPPEEYTVPLRQLVRDGRLSMETIDARVRDILRVKLWLGLLDQPYRTDPGKTDTIVRAPDSLALSERVARESIILLKNQDATLPLKKSVKRVLVTGPLADNADGWRSRYGPQRLDFVTPLAGIRDKLGDQAEVRYVQGVAVKDRNWPESDVYKEPPSAEVRAGIDAAVTAARDVDVIIACMGETDELCRESRSRISLDLPGYQQELLEALHATGKPVVLVLSNGRPLSVYFAARHIPAIVEMWLPGEPAGAALADVLFGDYNPAGRLPVTVPKSVGQIPLNFPAKPGSQAEDGGQVTGPLYPFGHGLSYTSFAYSNLRVTPDKQRTQGQIEVSIDVANSGQLAGDEVVQLYLRDDFSSVTTFEKELRGFERIHLEPGKSKTVSFTLTPEHLQLFNADHEWVVEPGRFTVMVGASSEDIRATGHFTITRPDGTAPKEATITGDTVDPL